MVNVRVLIEPGPIVSGANDLEKSMRGCADASGDAKISANASRVTGLQKDKNTDRALLSVSLLKVCFFMTVSQVSDEMVHCEVNCVNTWFGSGDLVLAVGCLDELLQFCYLCLLLQGVQRQFLYFLEQVDL